MWPTPQPRTLIFSFIVAKLKFYCNLGVRKCQGFETIKIPFNFRPRSCDQPPQPRTLIFSFIWAKLKVNCQNGVNKCQDLKRRKVSVSGKIVGILGWIFQKWTKKNVQNRQNHSKYLQKGHCDWHALKTVIWPIFLWA